ncbi:RidA family protein [Myceligenerans salitolerans]|uniref:RidA family protein n=1 Tax=Myceligenerans salitolerans TaxID=1230528 RepID=A0ABS3IAT5_9MICO|nr:RidA family protein [Myceligenerans salitolerans]
MTGRDPATGEIPETLDEQAANMFGHVRELLLAAGGGTDDILTMTVRLAGYRDRAALNAQWEKMFPDPRTRPARHVVTASLDRGQLIQCDLLAVLPPDDATPVDGGPGPHTRETKESEQP